MNSLNDLSRAFTEIEVVLQNSSTEVRNKIPESFMKLIEKYKAKDYRFKYDREKPLKEQKLSDMTLELIGMIYRDFICSDEEKKKYEKTIRELEARLEEEKREKYNPNDVFKDR